MNNIIKRIVFNLLIFCSCYTHNNASIDEQHAAAITQKALSLSEPVLAQKLKGGLSGAQLFTITTSPKKYVIRFLGNKPEADIRKEIDIVTIASKESYGPHIYYTDKKQAIIIMDFLTHTKTTLELHELLYTELACLLRTMHTGPEFPGTRDIFGEIETRLKHIKSINDNIIPLDKLENTITIIRQALTPHLTTAPCHNDLNWGNLIFLGPNGNNEFKAIDFEKAAQSDPYFDVATIANFFFHTPGSEKILLKEYLGRNPTQIENAKLYLMKQLAWSMYGLSFLKKTRALFPLYQSLKIPTYKDYTRGRLDDSTNLENAEYQLITAKVMITQVLERAQSQEFQEAINILKMHILNSQK